MSLPMVSVVIATRDRPEMLREAVTGVLDQAYGGMVEILVVHDQSEPDHTIVSLSRPGRDIRVMGNARRTGLAGSRNTGIEAALGEYIGFCDDDDVWLPEKLERQVPALASGDAVLSTCGIVVEYGGESHPRFLDRSSVDFVDLLRDRHTELHPSTFLMSKALLLDGVGLVSEDIPGGFGEDYEFLLRATKTAAVVNVRTPLVRVRWGRQSYFFRRWESMAAGLSWLLARYPEFESVPSGAARVRGQVAFAHAALGNRVAAVRWAWSAVRRDVRQPRAYLALAVAMRLLSPHTVMEQLHKRGRGI